MARPIQRFIGTTINPTGICVDATLKPIKAADQGPLRVTDPGTFQRGAASIRDGRSNPTAAQHFGAGVFGLRHNSRLPAKVQASQDPSATSGEPSLSDQFRAKLEAGAKTLIVCYTAGDPFPRVSTLAEFNSPLIKHYAQVMVDVVTMPDGKQLYAVGLPDSPGFGNKHNAEIITPLGKVVKLGSFFSATIVPPNSKILFRDKEILLPEPPQSPYNPHFSKLTKELANLFSLTTSVGKTMGDSGLASRASFKKVGNEWLLSDRETYPGINLRIMPDGRVELNVTGNLKSASGNPVFLIDASGRATTIAFAANISGKTLIFDDLVLVIPSLATIQTPAARPKTITDDIDASLRRGKAITIEGSRDSHVTQSVASPFHSLRPDVKVTVMPGKSQDGSATVQVQFDDSMSRPVWQTEGDAAYREFPDDRTIEITSPTSVGVVSEGQLHSFLIRKPPVRVIDFMNKETLNALPAAVRNGFFQAIREFFPSEWRDRVSQYQDHPVVHELIQNAMRVFFQILQITPGQTGSVEATKNFKRLVVAFHPDRATQNGLTTEAAQEKFKIINNAKKVLDALIRN